MGCVFHFQIYGGKHYHLPGFQADGEGKLANQFKQTLEIFYRGTLKSSLRRKVCQLDSSQFHYLYHNNKRPRLEYLLPLPNKEDAAKLLTAKLGSAGDDFV